MKKSHSLNKDTQGMGNTSLKNRCCDENLLKPKGHFFSENVPQKSGKESLNFWSESDINYDGTPEKVPVAPHPSPVDCLQEPDNSRLSDSFKTESFKALLNQIAIDKNLKQVIEDPTELPITGFVSNNNALHYAGSSSFNACKNSFLLSSTESNKINVLSGFAQLECFNLDTSMSTVSLNTDYGSPCTDGISLLAQRSSEASDISSTETEESVSDAENLTLESQDSLESNSTRWEIHSPRKPLSAMGKFLNKRKLLRKRDRFSSVDTIRNPVYISEIDSRKSGFLQTV